MPRGARIRHIDKNKIYIISYAINRNGKSKISIRKRNTQLLNRMKKQKLSKKNYFVRVTGELWLFLGRGRIPVRRPIGGDALEPP